MLLSRRFWLGLVVTAGFLFVFLWRVDFGDIGRELQNANYAYFVPALLLYFVAFWFRSLRWRYLLLHLKPISPWRLYPVVSIGYLANNILPLRLGELVRAHFAGEKEGISKASALASIGVERVMDGLTLLLFAAIVWPFLPWTDVLRNDSGDLKALWLGLSVLVVLGLAGGFLVLVLLAASPDLGRRLAGLAGSLAPPPITRPKVEGVFDQLVIGLGALRSPRRVALICLLSVPVWLLEATMYYVIALSFDLGQPFHVLVLVTATSNLATAIPASIGGIGPFEVVAKSTLVAFGVAAEPAVAYAFFVHIVALWLPVNLLGLLFLWKEKVSLSQFARPRGMDLPLMSRPAGGIGEGQRTAEEGEGG